MYVLVRRRENRFGCMGWKRGEVCRHGHLRTPENTYKDGSCKQCRKRYSKKWADANPIKVAERKRRFLSTNPGKSAEYSRAYNERHPERRREISRSYYERNLDVERERGRKYKLAHPEVSRKSTARRRARKVANGSVEDVCVLVLGERDGWVCYLCNTAVDASLDWPDPWSKSIEHVIPLSKGGPHTYDNTKVAHLRCNQRKHVKDLDELEVGFHG